MHSQSLAAIHPGNENIVISLWNATPSPGFPLRKDIMSASDAEAVRGETVCRRLRCIAMFGGLCSGPSF